MRPRRSSAATCLLLVALALAWPPAAAQEPVDLDGLLVREAPPGFETIYADPGVGPIQEGDYDGDIATYIRYGLENGVPGWIRYFLTPDEAHFVLLYGWAAADDEQASTIFGLVDAARNLEDRGVAFPVPEIEGVRTGLSDQGNATVLFRVGNIVFAALGSDQTATVDVAVRQHARALAPPTTTTTTVASTEDEDVAPVADDQDDEDDDGFPVAAIPAGALVVAAGAGVVTARRRLQTDL